MLTLSLDTQLPLAVTPASRSTDVGVADRYGQALEQADRLQVDDKLTGAWQKASGVCWPQVDDDGVALIGRSTARSTRDGKDPTVASATVVGAAVDVLVGMVVGRRMVVED